MVGTAAWKPMLYALCFVHTIVQERRKFGPLGFNVPYEFSTADLSASMTFLQNHLGEVEAKKRPVDWPTVNYMVCEVQYGGRITDDWDRRLLNTYGQACLVLQPLAPLATPSPTPLHPFPTPFAPPRNPSPTPLHPLPTLFAHPCQAWLAPRILEPSFEFYRGYRVPSGGEVESYRKYAEGLPLIDDPEIFGLHANADLVFRTAQTQQARHSK